VEKIIDVLPPLVMMPLYYGFKIIPDWKEMPQTIIALMKKLTPLSELSQNKEKREQVRSDDELIISLMIGITILKIFQKAFFHSSSFCPRNLSVDLSLVGEGGGFTLSGHPSQVMFAASLTVVEIGEAFLSGWLSYIMLPDSGNIF
jgi:hypothetical protein